MRGAWVEIALARECAACGGGRSPCGERGLKFLLTDGSFQLGKSLPVRGAWVEICYPRPGG